MVNSNDRETERRLRRFFDGLVVCFGLLCAVLVVISSQDRHLVVVRVIVCFLPATLLHVTAVLLRHRPFSRFLWISRYAIPLFFLAFFFRLTGQIAPFFPLGTFDAWIVQLDGLLFGDPQLSVNFQSVAPLSSPIFGEYMCFAYVAYFFFMPVFGGILIVSGVWKQPGPKRVCAWYIMTVLVTFYLHYMVFFLFPVQGPAFHFDAGIALDPGLLINRFHHMIVSRGDVPGGCFPSSHVAIALVHALIAWRLRWRWLCAISAAITVSICFSIVYTRTHYAADAVAGLISGILCWFLTRKIETVLARRPAAPGAVHRTEPAQSGRREA